MRIGYFGDGPWAHLALRKLLADESVTVSFICARHDNPDPILEEIGRENDILFVSHPRVNSDDFFELVKRFSCDLFVSMSFNQIFHSTLRKMPRLGTINCHAGKLPFYRGRNVLNWVLINDETEFGITVHFVDDGIDTGDIILQQTYEISDSDDYSSLLSRAYLGCADNLFKAVKMIERGRIVSTPQTQIHPIGTYCSRRIDGDERLNWKSDSREIFNFIRAISSPGPQATTYLDEHEVKINKAVYIHDAPRFIGIPGAVLGVKAGSFLVKTRDSVIEVVEWSGWNQVRVGDRFKCEL